MFDHKEIAIIIINIIFVASFIGVFFFTYASKVEEQVVKDQMSYIVKDLLSDIALLPANDVIKLRAQVQSLHAPDMTSADNQVAINNNALQKKALLVIGLMLGIGLAIVYMLSKRGNFNFLEVFGEGLIILTFVGLTEFCFLTFLASKFISANPNFVKKTLVDKIYDKATST